MSNASESSVSLLQQLIAIPSLSREEGAAADFFQQYIDQQGVKTFRKGNNIWAFAKDFDASKKTILLNSHIDTVRPADSWTRNPYEPTIEDGKLYGLGSNDAGASLVSLLQTFLILKEKELPYNLIFSCSAEEEVSGKNGCSAMMEELPKIDLAIVGEPTGMQLAVAEKGLLVLDCTAHGVSGHAARNEGDNAIYKALKNIEWFRTYQFSKVSELTGPVKMSVTIINAGTLHNVVPDKCTFTVDVRVNECYTNLQVLDEIRRNVSCDVVPRSTDKNSSSISIDHPIVLKGKSLGLKCFGSPTSSDQMRIPYTSIKVGPGESSRSHGADEFIKLDEIEQGIEIYLQLLENLKF